MAMLRAKLLLLIVLMFSCVATAHAQSVPQTELDALMAIYDATDGENWSNNANWGVGTDPGTWHGVSTSGGHVSTIYLYQNHLVGTIPASIGDLTSVTWLFLYSNQLTGSIPGELGNLTSLEMLALRNNQFTGAIPATLGNLTNLREMNLYSNQLTGSIPPELGNMTSLELLDLHENLLTGTIPEALTKLTNLQNLYLDIEEFDYHAVGYTLYQFMTARGVVFPDDYEVPPPPTAAMDAVRFLLLSDSGSTSPPTDETSYKNFKEIGLTPQSLPSGENTRAYGNFSGSGRTDLFTATITYWPPTTPEDATPSTFEFWLKQPDGSFVKDTQMLTSSDGCIHPRKAIVADFNNDDHPDVFVACHGYDAVPFPGERNKIVLSQANGTYSVQDASTDIGFFHSASATDLDGDDLPDVMVANNLDAASVYVLLNQGAGVFEREAVARLPATIGGKPYFSVELVDVDGDELNDVLLGGHEWEGASTVAILNPGSYNFQSVTPIILPAISNEGVVLDFVVTGMGPTRSVWILRTSGGDGTFYESRTVQKVLWPSLSSSVPLSERPAAWFPWIIPTTINEVNVIASDDASINVAIPQ